MKTIGLIGEDPNDTISVKNLLLQKHPTGLVFKQLLKNRRGYQLDNARVEASLKIEFEEVNPHFVLFIRDVDGLPSEAAKIKKVDDWFKKLNSVVNGKGILLMNIYELEALILADIKTFSKHYNLKPALSYTKNVMYQQEPKEFLMLKTTKAKSQYQESHCPKIFEQLNFENVLLNCTYFRDFYADFKKKVGL
jgi:hypothetical protein